MADKRAQLPARHELKYFINPAELEVLRARLFDLKQSQLDAERSSARKLMVGNGDRSEKIRTYNYPQDRITDHRINLSVHNLPSFMMGNMDEMLDALNVYAKEEQFKELDS